MPKTAKTPRARLHTKAAALAKAERKQQMEAGDDAGQSSVLASSNPVGSEVAVSGADRARLDKRRKAAMVARAAAANPISALGTPSTHPYSRSHLKRLKRKARENLAGGSLTAIEGALADVMPPADEKKEAKPVKNGRGMDVDGEVVVPQAKVSKSDAAGRIGEGKGKPLKEKQKRKELVAHQAHLRAVLQNPAYRKNPFEAIRIHASNSMAMQEKP